LLLADGVSQVASKAPVSLLIVGSTERLNQVVNGCLILGIDLDCFSALFGSFSILSVLEI